MSSHNQELTNIAGFDFTNIPKLGKRDASAFWEILRPKDALRFLPSLLLWAFAQLSTQLASFENALRTAIRNKIEHSGTLWLEGSNPKASSGRLLH